MSKFEIPSLPQLLEVGAHFGHVARRWNPKMAPYIYDERKGVHIFDLVKTQESLEKACDFLQDVVSKGGQVILVGTKAQAVEVIREESARVGIPYVITRWIGGTLTNWEQIKKSIDSLVEMRKKMAEGGYDKYTKKERVLFKREIDRLERLYGGLVNIKGMPAVIFIVDPNRESVAIKEAQTVGVKTVAIVDSNGDPEGINYVIPANDDALKSVKLIVKTITVAIEEGMKKAVKADSAKKEEKNG